jgi:hypothetical protein
MGRLTDAPAMIPPKKSPQPRAQIHERKFTRKSSKNGENKGAREEE